MRLLVATPLYPPDSGGPATYAAILERLLPAEGVSVSLALFSEVRHLPKLVRHVAYAWMVYSRARHVDVVLALDPVSTGLPAMIAARMAGKPFIVKVVGDYAWEQGVQRFGVTELLDDFVQEKHVPVVVNILRAIQRLVALSAKKVIVPSEYLKRIVGTWQVPKERIVVIPNAFEFDGNVESEKQKMRTIVTAGRLVPWKGVVGVIEAMPMVWSKYADVQLVVAGDGPERSSLERLAQTTDSKRIRFMGTLAHDELMKLIKSADVFVLNSTYEGLSHLLLESLSLGTPTVATNVGGNPEIIQDGQNGLLVSAGDTTALAVALTRALGDTQFADTLSREAKKTKDNFSTGRMIGSLVSLIRSAV